MIGILVESIPTFLGVVLGGIVSVMVYKWQKIKQEKQLAKILINILEDKEGEVTVFLDDVNMAKREYNLEEGEITESNCELFLLRLQLLTIPMISKLPDLKISYQIGIGYIYEILDLRRIYSYFNQIEILVEYSMVRHSQNNHAYIDMYKTINNKLINKISEYKIYPLEKLKKFESKSTFWITIKSFIPCVDIYKDLYKK